MNELDHSNRTEYSSLQFSCDQRALQGYPASHKAVKVTVRKKAHNIQRLLTGKDVLVAILRLVLRSLPLLPGVQELALLLLQHLWAKHTKTNCSGHTRGRGGSYNKLLGFPRLRECWQDGKGAEIQFGEGPNWFLIGGEGKEPCREQQAHNRLEDEGEIQDKTMKDDQHRKQGKERQHCKEMENHGALMQG